MTPLLSPGSFSHRALALLLAWLMVVSPRAMLVADDSAKGQDHAKAEVAAMAKLLPGAAALLVIKPMQILRSPLAQGLPYEVLQAASMKETGLDPLEMQSLVIAGAPPDQGSPSYAVRATFRGPIELKPGQATAHTQEGTLKGKTYWQSQEMMAPSFYSPDAKTLVAAPDFTLRSALETPEDGNGALSPFMAKCLKAVGKDDMYLAADLATIRPFILMGLAFATDIPPELAPLKALPELLAGLEFRCNLTQKQPTELVFTANDEKAADKIIALVESMKKLAAEKSRQASEQLLASSDPVEQAMGRYQERVTKLSQEQFKLQREGDKIVLFRLDASNPDTTTVLVMTAITGTLVALLLPAIAAARDAARRTCSMNNVRQIEIGLLQYEADHACLPAYANFDTNGKPLLSWRVHVLPYLGENELYEAFHLDEPWDSQHNKKLIPRMPALFRNPTSQVPADAGTSDYLGVVGQGCAFTGGKEGLTMAEVTDGLSRTVSVVQVSDDAAEVWTCPADWKMDPANPTQGLGGLQRGGWIAGFMDASCRLVDDSIDPTVWKALLTTSGGEAVGADY